MAIFFCRPKQVKLPARLDTFIYGATGYLSISNHAEAIDVALVGNAAEIIMELRRAADELEKNLFLRQHREQTRRAKIRQAQDWDWLTPEMVVRYFEQSPILRPVAADVRAVLAAAFTAPATSPPLGGQGGASQLEMDLAAVQPHLALILAGGRINKSEIARALGIAPGGSSNWPRVTAVAQALRSSTAVEAADRDEFGAERAA